MKTLQSNSQQTVNRQFVVQWKTLSGFLCMVISIALSLSISAQG